MVPEERCDCKDKDRWTLTVQMPYGEKVTMNKSSDGSRICKYCEVQGMKVLKLERIA
jgi:hypothetical protein